MKIFLYVVVAFVCAVLYTIAKETGFPAWTVLLLMFLIAYVTQQFNNKKSTK